MGWRSRGSLLRTAVGGVSEHRATSANRTRRAPARWVGDNPCMPRRAAQNRSPADGEPGSAAIGPDDRPSSARVTGDDDVDPPGGPAEAPAGRFGKKKRKAKRGRPGQIDPDAAPRVGSSPY